MATLNVNGLASFLRKEEIDIAFVQEVKQTHFNTLNIYTTYINEGTARRGTVILVRDGVILTNVTQLPKGRDVATEYQGIWLVNIYKPSGATSTNERENFFNSDFTYLLPASPSERILAGDFNCDLEKQTAPVS
jgi:exonuclease III